jgi:dipeptidyl-peptidase-3
MDKYHVDSSSQYNDIRENVGSKNLFVNRMFANSSSPGATEYLRLGDAEVYKKNLHIIRFVATAIHEVLGHGTGKLLSETEPGKFNFDPENPPLSPHTGRPVQSWYRHGQTWTGVFEDLAVTVEECRAILISAYLIDNRDLLHTFGYNEDSDPTEDGLIYLSYLHLGVEGIRSLEHYNKHERTWTEAHNQAYSAIFKYLPLEGERLLTVQFDPLTSGLSVHLDCTKISSHGKVALGQLLCRLHVWRCTADVKPCRDYYGQLTAVEGRYEAWREFVSDRPQPRWKFVQANTFVPSEGKVEIKVYEESNEGIVQSWAERDTKPPPI